MVGGWFCSRRRQATAAEEGSDLVRLARQGPLRACLGKVVAALAKRLRTSIEMVLVLSMCLA